MAFTCGFFNSENGDRKYNAEQMSAIFDGIIADGVFTTIGDHMAVSAGTGMQVLVGTGKAWFDHTWNVNDAAYPLAIAASDVTLSRIDAIVLETNHSDSVRLNKLRVVQGSVASSPVKPTLTNSEKVRQHPLAWVTVAPGVTKIAASAIENAVGTSACPFVTGIIATTAIDDLFNQWNGEFDEWFDNLKAQLSDNVVANLQRQIDEAKTAQHTIISDKTATDLGITPKSSTDAALQTLSMVISMIKLNKGGINLTVLSSGGNPVPGVRVSGILDANGNELETDSNGKLTGYMNEGSVTLKITGYADIADYSETITVVKGNIINKTITVTIHNFLKITSSKSVKFSGNVNTVDVTVVGGGGGGSSSANNNQGVQTGGNGGGGGYCVLQTNVSVQNNQSYNAIIGAGGKGGVKVSGAMATGQTGKDGGQSSFMGVIAAGGKGGGSNTTVNSSVQRAGAAGGNGNGGLACYRTGQFGSEISGSKGGAGTVEGYISFSEKALFGGGGGGGMGGYNQNGGSSSNPGYAGGSPYGAAGGAMTTSSECNGRGARANTGGGGGGAGMESNYDGEPPANANGGSGGSGIVTIRMHLKNAV